MSIIKQSRVAMRGFIMVNFLFLLMLSAQAQVIDDDYQKLGVIQRDERTHNMLPFVFLADESKDIVLIGYDFTPTKWEAYSLQNWQKVSYFETKGHALYRLSYFHPTKENIVYIKKNGGKLISEVNYKEGTVVKMKCKDLPQGCSQERKRDYESFWQEDYRRQIFFYKDYAFEVEDYVITAYKRDK